MSETVVVIEEPLSNKILVNVQPADIVENTIVIDSATPQVAVNFTTGQAEDIYIVQPVTQEVAVTLSNQQGPQGIQGIQGIQGESGGPASVFYIHNQSIPSATWTITHNLNGHPTAVVMDSAGTMCEGQFTYPSTNQMVITFSSSFGGTAYII